MAERAADLVTNRSWMHICTICSSRTNGHLQYSNISFRALKHRQTFYTIFCNSAESAKNLLQILLL